MTPEERAAEVVDKLVEGDALDKFGTVDVAGLIATAIRQADNEAVERVAAHFDAKGPGGWNQQFAEETAAEIRSLKSKEA